MCINILPGVRKRSNKITLHAVKRFPVIFFTCNFLGYIYSCFLSHCIGEKKKKRKKKANESCQKTSVWIWSNRIQFLSSVLVRYEEEPAHRDVSDVSHIASSSRYSSVEKLTRLCLSISSKDISALVCYRQINYRG